jgi:hypothetical protein
MWPGPRQICPTRINWTWDSREYLIINCELLIINGICALRAMFITPGVESRNSRRRRLFARRASSHSPIPPGCERSEPKP